MKSILYLIKGVLVLLPYKGATLASWVRLEYLMGATYKISVRHGPNKLGLVDVSRKPLK